MSLVGTDISTPKHFIIGISHSLEISYVITYVNSVTLIYIHKNTKMNGGYIIFYLRIEITILRLRGAFGKYVARSFFSVTDKQTHSCLVSF